MISHEQSHGESFLALMTNRFGGNGLYILDEPEAALSPQRQLAALARIHDLVKAQSQFIIATHSPILMSYPRAHIYVCSPEGIGRIDYPDTEHYRVMHDFVVNPKRMLDAPLAPDDKNGAARCAIPSASDIHRAFGRSWRSL